MIRVDQLKTTPGMNVREHYMARSRRVKLERETTGWALKGSEKPALPCTVTLTRTAPSEGLDAGACDADGGKKCRNAAK
jgi:hypothetical protein